MEFPNRLVLTIICSCAIGALAGCSPAGDIPTETANSRADVTGLADRTREGILAYLAAEARKITDRAKAETSSSEAWEAVRSERRAELMEMLGLGISRPRTPLNVEVRGAIERTGYRVERIAFQSIPKVYVTANLYLPTSRDGPVPGVIYVCGHAYSPHGAKTSYQRHGHTLARHGYAALIIDPIQIAETVGLHHGVFNQEMHDWYTRGYSPAGLEVWNVIRALDYLETRPEIDRERFAITGRSGGAAMSWFAAAVEPRIKAAVPIMGIGTYGVSVPEDTQRMHCDCMYPVNFRMHDLIHLGALIAPRPVLTAHGREDPLFPVAGYEEFERAMTTLYASYGAPSRFRNLVVDSGHEDSDLLRAEAVRWLDRWLLGSGERRIDTGFREIEAADLAVFGGDSPGDARNHEMHEYFVPPAPPLRRDDRSARESDLDRIREALLERVLHTLPRNRVSLATRAGSLRAPANYESLAFDYEGYVPVETQLHIPDRPNGPALLHLASPGEDPPSVQRLLRNLRRFGRNPVLVAYLPGTGTAVWPKSEWKMLLRNAMQTGRTVDSIRVGAAIAAGRLLRQRAGVDEIAVSGIGAAAGWAIYAAAVDKSISHAILVDPPSSHRHGPILLGASRYADLPSFAALLAPRQLTFFGRMPAAYAVTEQGYSDLDAAPRISVSMSIGAALNGHFGHGYAIGM